MTTSALRRQVKNLVHNYSDAEIKVREATSNDPWGPSSSLMSEIAELTFSVVAFSEVMAMVWKRLNDHGKNWRHVYKALTLLDYLAKTLMSSSSSPRASDLEQTRPQTSGEEELQLQLALAMSREEQCSHQGDDAPLQEALEESKGERDPRPSESAMIDLVDIFGPTPAAQVSDDPWDAPPTCSVNSDPWESVAVVKSSNPVTDSPWTARSSSSSPAHPWGTHQSPPDPWDAPPSNSTSNIDEKARWRSPARPVSSVKDPFTIPEEEELIVEGEEPIVEQVEPNQVFSPRCESPADADQFGELVAGVQVNGRGNDSPETFDLSRLGPPLDAVSPRQCRTPEAFLGPTAASLVNLDTLIPTNPPVKSKNPFLSAVFLLQCCLWMSCECHGAY
ncbi:epsin-3-like [Sinocyclocheilus grahami]|uniref:epsin-3-like n=1 Tax=Sinocyclocheilus grahami TaxID=75366 RepID=UPI0007ACD42D|nr:PREDICTED: epsin-3-like [Sinocyclocheilus grahami]